jgi:hypothetical protein
MILYLFLTYPVARMVKIDLFAKTGGSCMYVVWLDQDEDHSSTSAMNKDQFFVPDREDDP